MSWLKSRKLTWEKKYVGLPACYCVVLPGTGLGLHIRTSPRPAELVALNIEDGTVPSRINVIPAGPGIRGIDGRTRALGERGKYRSVTAKGARSAPPRCTRSPGAPVRRNIACATRSGHRTRRSARRTAWAVSASRREGGVRRKKIGARDILPVRPWGRQTRSSEPTRPQATVTIGRRC